MLSLFAIWLCYPGSDPRKPTSYVRARNSGVNRLLRSNTSSVSSAGSTGSRAALSNGQVSNGQVSNGQVSNGVPTSGDRVANPSSSPPETVNPVEEDEVAVNAQVNVSDPVVESTATSAKSVTPASGGSASAVEDEVEEAEDEANSELSDFQEHKWSHVVLKMTAFTEDDVVTSFRFDAGGGGIGRDPCNTASIPADKLLAHKDHARLLYSRGRFYLENGENTSGTFVRLSPCSHEVNPDDDEDRMQWPLEPDASFRVGKSDFLVTDFDDATQTLDVVALSGKLTGTTFKIGSDGAGIGRSADNAIHTGDGELSRKHAAIWFDELTNLFYLVDLNSTNGTFMKLVGPYQEPYRLEIGDDILIAQTCLTVNRFDFGAHANMGARKHMEDAHTIIQDLCIESLSRLGLHPQSFFAVYDGHGGDEASAFLGDELHHSIIDEFFFKKDELKQLMAKSQDEIHAMIQHRLVAAFEKTDELFLQSSEHPQAGSTATTVLIAGNHLFVANTGDSRTVLSRKGVASRLSNDHKPNRPDEAQRVRDTGGFVIHGRIMGELAVSRAFGDSPFKTFELPEPPKEDVNSKPRSDYDSQELPVNPNEILKGPLVIPTPEITVTELTGTLFADVAVLIDRWFAHFVV